jgi:uncharacterized lipoprotein YehR (DUF1307 family)
MRLLFAIFASVFLFGLSGCGEKTEEEKFRDRSQQSTEQEKFNERVKKYGSNR